ncbi:MAG TPA: carbamoyl-phosphate synthase large subunit [Syntrophorhabdaceae bacterium]|nr:carbamoyl-phosphate synthase large subunit [Syntrophorhabdaceae bacterium]
MPKRDDIKSVLIIGSGPIIIGQACEFDYSGAQACKALKEEGFKVILINSNPATIMTDPELAHVTYIEPITPYMVERIIEKERPDAILPTLGGQTALNVSLKVAEDGYLDRFHVEMIGANVDAIRKAEDRSLFKKAMKDIGLLVPESGYAKSISEAMEIAEQIDYPLIIRPSFTLGGTGGNIAYNRVEFEKYVQYGLDASPYHEILIEESVIGWKEYELEVMRDRKDNVVIICSIENLDPMGVHTGDSITVAPAQTLTDKEYQIMRDAAIKVIREIGVDTGGSNIQFAINPKNGKMYVIEMNPRVSRSSALASKATGFPIAKIAAKLAVGYTLDEIPNDITKKTPASFEPTIDYVVVKIPRFAFEKFPESDQTLTTQMKSVGEVMAIGRTFKEAFHKAIRSLEIGSYGLSRKSNEAQDLPLEAIIEKLRTPNWERLWYIANALKRGIDIDEIYEYTYIDRWFLNNIKDLVDFEEVLKRQSYPWDINNLRQAKELGFSDRYLSEIFHVTEDAVREARKNADIVPVYKTVDTCAAEFPAYTPYLYSTYEKPFYSIDETTDSLKTVLECEADPTDRKKVMILGSGPNRIGQGIEFDYCCVHAAFALKEEGFETIMVNCNPETVSTDYDTSDRLYFEPLTFEDVMSIVEKERPYGVIVQFGGQTPLKLAVPLARAGVNILGTSPDSIDRAEDRKRFDELLTKLNLKRPESGTAMTFQKAMDVANTIGYPVMVRPSYVLGGRAMEIVYDEKSLADYMKKAQDASPEHPILIDRFLENAVEVDVDAISDGIDVVIGGIMEHIEEAGIHSGDSACSIPPYSLSEDTVSEIKRQTILLAKELNVVGLMNCQYAVKDGEIYILEVNPRASRTIPFVSKATSRPLAKIAAKLMIGKRLKDMGITEEIVPAYTSVKEAVFSFIKFPGVDTLLGPEMKSTGEVMGTDCDFGRAFAKSQIGAGYTLPTKGTVFISVNDDDKPQVLSAMKMLSDCCLNIVATTGTAEFLNKQGIATQTVKKMTEGRPNVVDKIKNNEIAMIINIPKGIKSVKESYYIRRAALLYNIPYFTTIAGAKAAALAISTLVKEELHVTAIQEHYTLNKICNNLGVKYDR